MKTVVFCMVAVGCLLFAGVPADAAEQGLVEIVADGCKAEIDTYCKDVTPGEGRVLACLFAREDKLSMRCQYALYDASAQLQQAVAALTYLANECRDDLKTFCSGVKAGEGRLIKCIDKNMDKVSSRCKQAIKDVSRK
jgi:hypothetical protein